MDTEVLARWVRFLQRRGIIVEQGTSASQSLLTYYGAEGIYDKRARTIYLTAQPSASAFYEEAFHALQHRAGLIDLMILPGLVEREVSRWEYEAKVALIRHRHKLHIPNRQTRVTVRQLRRLKLGFYD